MDVLPPFALSIELLVPERGLEPPRLAAPGPKPGAYTNFATPAYQSKHNRNRPLCLVDFFWYNKHI